MQAVFDVGEKMGGSWKFRSAMGDKRLDLLRIPGDSFRDMAIPNYGSWFLPDVILPDVTFNFSDDNAKFTVAHELGHVWDYRQGYKFSNDLVYLMDTLLCIDEGCSWVPLGREFDDESGKVIMIAPEPYPGTKRKCIDNKTGLYDVGDPDCGDPYAAQYGGAGDLFEDPGWEDWAESFASYVYPHYYLERSKVGLVEGGIRETYIMEQIEAIP